ncbi:MAG TPA: GNAT family N-acetyltransferase [bacterium]|nr:GNAT family N-acetyltransferase [bacterium]
MRGNPLIIDPVAESDAIVELWNRHIGNSFQLDRSLLLQQLRLDTDPRLCLGTRDASGHLTSVILVKRAARPGPDGAVPAIGYLSWLLVDQNQRRQGTGTALLAQAGRWWEAHGASTVRLGSDHYHLFPGRPVEHGPGWDAFAGFAGRFGFSGEGIECDLIADLRSLDAARPVASAELTGHYAYIAFDPKRTDAVMAFMERAFPGRWADEIAEAMAAGLRPDDLALAVDTRDGAIVGFSRIYDAASPVRGPSMYWLGLLGSKPGGLGPIGVDSSRRGEGLGMGLLRYCVRELATRGVETMVIDWTDLVDFYGKIGFKVWKRYETMKAEIKNLLQSISRD